MKIINLVIAAATLAAWFTYTYPRLYYSTKVSAIRAMHYLRYIVSVGIGWLFGAALGGLL